MDRILLCSKVALSCGVVARHAPKVGGGKRTSGMRFEAAAALGPGRVREGMAEGALRVTAAQPSRSSSRTSTSTSNSNSSSNSSSSNNNNDDDDDDDAHLPFESVRLYRHSTVLSANT